MSRIEELSFAIREGELDFAAAAIRYSEGPESAQGGRIDRSPDAGHPELKGRLAKANEGDLIGLCHWRCSRLASARHTHHYKVGRKATDQLLQELYKAWMDRQLSSLEVGDSIEPGIPAL